MSKAPIQLLVNLYDGTLLEPGQVDFKKYRAMRGQPTIALARAYMLGMIMSSSWVADADEEDESAKPQLEFIEEHILPLREEWLRVALAKYIDFGWSAVEVEYDSTEGVTKVAKLHHLKNDWTWARYFTDRNEFAGLKVRDHLTGQEVYIDPDHCLFCSFDEEGLGGYGEPVLKRCASVYDSWMAANDALSRYSQKIAGGLVLIRAPQGSSLVQGDDDVDGVQQERDNALIAANLAATMKNNGALTLPALQQMAGLQQSGWTVEFLESQGQQQNFISGLEYYDKQFIRAFGISDRAVLEAEHGSKADAAVATSASGLHLSRVHEQLTHFFDCKLVEKLLTVNFGEPKAWLKAVPLGDDRVELYTKMFELVAGDPGSGPELLSRVDIDSLAEVVNVPLLPEEEAREIVEPPAPVLPGTQPNEDEVPPQSEEDEA